MLCFLLQELHGDCSFLPIFPKSIRSVKNTSNINLEKMKKWIGLLKSVVFSLIVYMWFLGSSLLVQIDSRQISEERDAAWIQQQSDLQRKWENEENSLSKHIQSNCIVKESNLRNKLRENEPSHNANLTDQETKGKEENAAKEKFRKVLREKVVRDNLIYIPELQQLWCLVPKAASTSWSHKIIDSIPDVHLNSKLQSDLRNVSVPIQVLLRKHFGNIGTKKYAEILNSNNIQRILLTRHPLSRIVSAFEDKLRDRKARLDSMYFYGRYGVKINRAFRKNKRLNKRKEPTFEEFIDYLIKTDPDEYDEHWKPISLLCGLCRINYNHVIKQEDLKDNLDFHLMRLKYDHDGSLRRKFRKENKSYKEFQTIKDYFTNITTEKKLLLLEKFEDDFRLFQYPINLT